MAKSRETKNLDHTIIRYAELLQRTLVISLLSESTIERYSSLTPKGHDDVELMRVLHVLLFLNVVWHQLTTTSHVRRGLMR